ncbi:MAG: DUF4190 domain-containing protein [Anaerolineales bacterium]|nr:DUF4190 domain-containing protein [Anaerolineales bacterium]
MLPNESISPSTNKQATVSLICGILAFVSLCGGIVPIPLTGFVCFPLSVLCGVLSIVYGIVALIQIRQTRESGKALAWTSLVLVGFIFLCLLSMAAVVVLLGYFAAFHVPILPTDFPNL